MCGLRSTVFAKDTKAKKKCSYCRSKMHSGILQSPQSKVTAKHQTKPKKSNSKVIWTQAAPTITHYTFPLEMFESLRRNVGLTMRNKGFNFLIFFFFCRIKNVLFINYQELHHCNLL